ncbi:MAG: FkbM family methyltransferase [Nitriliruptorales bacterium]
MASSSRLRPLLRLLPSFEEEMALLPDLVSPGAVCVDVGASYGIYAVTLARLVGRRGHVHAFEPRPRSLRVLRLSTRLLAPGNVTIHPLALGDRTATDTIVTPRRRWLLPVPGRSFLRGGLEAEDGAYYDGFEKDFADAHEREVVVRPLDDVATEAGIDRLDLVKVDVEGAELGVFDGAEKLIDAHRPVVICELEDRHTGKYGHGADEVLGWFSARRYRTFRLGDADLMPVERVVPRWNNYLLLPEEHGRAIGR